MWPCYCEKDITPSLSSWEEGRMTKEGQEALGLERPAIGFSAIQRHHASDPTYSHVKHTRYM